MLSFLSPCVLPLVPAYLSMVSGLSAAELSALSAAPAPAPPAAGRRPAVSGRGAGGAAAVAEPAPAPGRRRPGGVAGRAGAGRAPDPEELRRHRGRLLRGILAFIAGFTVVFTILGASASSLGRLFLTHQHTLETVSGILIVVFGAVLVAMAAGVTLPMALSGEKRFAVRPSVLGAWAPPVMGMAFAFAWTPCIGPVLGSVLALAAGTGGSADRRDRPAAGLLARPRGPVPAQRPGLRPDDRPAGPGAGAGCASSTWSAGPSSSPSGSCC